MPATSCTVCLKAPWFMPLHSISNDKPVQLQLYELSSFFVMILLTACRQGRIIFQPDMKFSAAPEELLAENGEAAFGQLPGLQCHLLLRGYTYRTSAKILCCMMSCQHPCSTCKYRETSDSTQNTNIIQAPVPKLINSLPTCSKFYS